MKSRISVDRVADAAHFGLALLYPLLLAGAGTTAKDGAWILLAVITLARAPFIWRVYLPLLRQPLVWAMIAWGVWRAVSLSWSVDLDGGWDELRAFRGLLLVVLLWPVADRAAWLIVSFLAGVLLHNGVQLAQALHLLGLEPVANGRLGGLVHPVTMGALCAAALGWHVSALLHWRGRSRWGLAATIVAALAAAAGLLLAGSRGPWLAAAISVPAAVAVIAVRRPATRRRAAVLAVAALALAAASWPVTGGFVRLRGGQALDDLRAAFGHDLDTHVGHRLAWWEVSWDIARRHPLVGTGAGGFDEAVAAAGHPDLGQHNHHAHNLYAHELAVLGAPGLLAGLAVLGLIGAELWRRPPADPWSDGSLIVLGSWAIGALSDCYQLNGTMAGLLGLLATLALVGIRDEHSASGAQQDAGAHGSR